MKKQENSIPICNGLNGKILSIRLMKISDYKFDNAIGNFILKRKYGKHKRLPVKVINK